MQGVVLCGLVDARNDTLEFQADVRPFTAPNELNTRDATQQMTGNSRRPGLGRAALRYTLCVKVSGLTTSEAHEPEALRAVLVLS
jgi:hypothetical protein